MWKRLASLALGIVLGIGATIALGPYFVRAPLTSGPNTCVIHLREIRGAKEQWAREYDKDIGDAPTWDDILPYFWPYCPAGGEYTVGPLGTDPTCTMEEHTEAYRTFKALTESTAGGSLESRGRASSEAN